MKLTSIISVTLLLSVLAISLPSAHGKRSFGIGRRTKTKQSYSPRRTASHSSHDANPKPSAPKSGSKNDSPLTKSTDQGSHSAPAPGWNTHNQHPAGPPPPYPGMGHNPVPSHGMPPGYSAYPQQSYMNPGMGHSPYGGMGGGMAMGGMGGMGMGAGMGMGGGMGMMPGSQPQRSSGGLSVGSMLMGMAAGGVATSLISGAMPRRHYTEQHIHTYNHDVKDGNPGSSNAQEQPQSPNEGLAPLITPDPVILATADQQNPNQMPAPIDQTQDQSQAPVEQTYQQPQMETIYAFNYAPAFMSTTTTSDQPTLDDDSSAAESTETDAP